MILDELELKLYEINKELPDINYGGCGTFSYHLKKVLKEKYNIKSFILLIRVNDNLVVR